MKKLIITLALTLTTTLANAGDYPNADAFGKAVAAILEKSGSWASCSLEGRDVEDGIKAVSQNYRGKFSTVVTTRPYGGDTSSMKACLVLNTK